MTNPLDDFDAWLDEIDASTTPEQRAQQQATNDAASARLEAWRDEYHRTPEGRAYLLGSATESMALYKATGAAHFLERHDRVTARLQELDR